MKTIMASLACIGIFLLSSCTSTKMAAQTEHSINGTWQLEKISTEGISGNFKAKVFDEEDFSCFIGSSWDFKKSNNTGSYTIGKNGGDCYSVTRNFRWSMYQAENGAAKQLQFKKLDTNMKEVLNDTGYRLTILQSTPTLLQVRSDLNFEGKPAAFIYTFTRM